MANQQISKKKPVATMVVPYRLLAIFFAFVALATLLNSFVNLLGIKTLISISYIVMNVMLVYGFWNMRKWIVTLMGITEVFLLISNSARYYLNTQRISSALMAVSVGMAIFLFALFTSSKLNGEFGNFRVIRVFVIALLISQLLFIF